MNILVIIAHPNIQESRVNSRWLLELQKHRNITIRNLYEVYQDEQIQVEKEQELLEQHDRIILQFPLYLYSAPSLLKKWIDQVMTYGFAYGSEGNKLHGKDLMLTISVGGPEEEYQAGGINRFTMSELLKPYQATSQLIGTNFLPSYVFYNAVFATDEEIDRSIADYIHQISLESKIIL